MTEKRRTRPVTLHDVARLAGVAPQTVSNVLHELKEARPDTRRRVEAAIAELGYRPNWAARSLRSKRVEAIGLILEDPNELELHDPLHGEFLNGVSHAARKIGYTVTVDFTAPDETDSRALRLVSERRVGGVVMSINNLGAGRRSTLQALVGQGVPVVLLQQWVNEPGITTVNATDCLGAEQAVAHLVAQGHRRLVYLSARPFWPAPKQRRKGFLSAVQAAGVAFAEWTCSAYTVEAARHAFAEAIQREPRPTAILAVNDVVALGAIQQAQAMGLAVPEDLSVIGFNDFVISSWVHPAITTVRVPGAEMGRRAVELIVGSQESGALRQSSTFQTDIVIRESTAPPRHPPKPARRPER